jgi:3-methyladenine DNA glycosylase AlkD
MEYMEAMNELKKLGTGQNRKVYKRHGSGDNLYGVSFANLRALGKKIKLDHKLAVKLWKSNNVDARILATMIADPDKMDKKTLQMWVEDIDYYVLCDEFVKSLVIRTEHAKELMGKWIESEKEYVGRAGWTIMSLLAMDQGDLSKDKYYQKMLKRIESDIHDSKNRTKQAMNNTLISIGIRNENLRDISLDFADRIGKVNVDVGKTYCKIPNARNYIQKTWKRRKR